jgi:hypothetical protein
VRTVEIEPTFEGWQAAARTLLSEGVAPAEVRWRESGAGQPVLLAETPSAARGDIRGPL